MATNLTDSSDPTNSGNDLLIVYTDIETDNLSGKYLLQIAAVTQDNQKFNTYINPLKPLALSTVNLLGLYFYRNDLYRDGLKLNSKYIVDALNAFMNWIRRLEKPVVLTFHNGFSFDGPVLSSRLVYFNIEIPSNLLAIADTLPFFRRNLKPPIVQDHKLSSLASHYSIDVERSHEALSDCITLKSICEKYVEANKVSLDTIIKENQRPIKDYLAKYLDGTPLPKIKKVKPKKKTT